MRRSLASQTGSGAKIASETSLSTENADVLFVGGTASNQGRFYRDFDHVVLHSAPTRVIVERLASRTNNPYGKHPDELARVLGHIETVERLLRRVATLEVDTSAPLGAVVEIILRLVQPLGLMALRTSSLLCCTLRHDVVQLAELTAREIRRLAEQGCLALVPTGCTEQQGPHLPVSFDTWLVETITRAAADETERRYGLHVLVLPALPFGPTPEHRSFGSGFIDLPRDLHETIVEEVLVSLADQRFRRIVVWRGCGGHDLRPAVARFNERAGHARAFLPDLPYHRIWCSIGDPANPGGHADAFATSLALHLRPEMVRRDLIANSPQSPVDWNDPQLDFARYSPTGVIGDPTPASAELGARLWRAVVAEVAQVLTDLARPDADGSRLQDLDEP